MKKSTVLLVFILILGNVNAQMKFNDFTDVEIYFRGIFNENCSVDDYGNILIDMGSASMGRYAFRVTDVTFLMEEKGEEPGCADICPPRIIIHFACRKSECIADPFHPDLKFQNGSITFMDLKLGKKAFEFLVKLQAFLKEND